MNANDEYKIREFDEVDEDATSKFAPPKEILDALKSSNIDASKLSPKKLEQFMDTHENGHVPKPHDSISESLSRFDFSIDDKLAVKLSTTTGEIPQPQNVLSASSSGNHRVVVERSTPDSIVNQLSDSNVSPQNAIPHNDNSIRGVDNISYDFKTKRKSYANMEPVEPWLYDDKFKIDRNPPDPSTFLLSSPSFLKRYIIPLVPTILLLISAIILSNFSSIAGIIALVMMVFCTVLAFPDIKTVSQKTPLSTLKAYIQARDGLCYAQGYALLAHKENQPCVNLRHEWSRQSPLNALINRLNPSPLPDSHVVAGSEESKSVLVIAITKDAYFLVPMISVDKKWYITDASLDRHPRENG